jgi:hypothetical protein
MRTRRRRARRRRRSPEAPRGVEGVERAALDPASREPLIQLFFVFFFAGDFLFADFLFGALVGVFRWAVFRFAAPPKRPPFRAGALFTFLPRPEPLCFPPPVIAFTVAHARFFAVFFDVPRFV